MDTKSMISRLNTRPNHILYNKHLQDPAVKIVVAVGSAGSGKTLLASSSAIGDLVNGNVRRIVITRPQVTLDEELGFIPGNIESKMMPWLIPIYDCFKEYVTAQRLKEYLANEEIEICPLAFVRGRTFHDSWIIADEVQNTTVNQMKSLVTRIGHNSKMAMTGDLQQCDMKEKNGLADFIERYRLYKNENEVEGASPIQIVEFGEDDVMRSDIVKYVLGVYQF